MTTIKNLMSEKTMIVSFRILKIFQIIFDHDNPQSIVVTNLSIWVSGDFNLGHIDWNTPAVIPNKPEASLHQQLLDILHDNNLTQVINKNTRKDTTLDLLCMTNPSFVKSRNITTNRCE